MVDFDRVRIRLTRPATGSNALDTLILFPRDSSQISLDLQVPVEGARETFAVTLALINAAGDTVFRAGPDSVTARPGVLTQAPATPEFEYTGVGSNAAGVRLVNPPPAAFFGDTVLFVAEAFDSGGTVIPNTPVLFFSSDTSRARVINVSQGRVAIRSQRGPVTIIAALLTEQTASHQLLVQPRPAAIVVQSGGAQAGTVGSALAQPVVARVRAADNLGVAGVVVTFAVTSGGGSLSQLLDTTDVNGDASATWTLGTAAGPQAVTATAAGLSGQAAVFNATAAPGAARRLEFTVQPGTVTAGIPISPPVRVVARDTFGNVATSFTGNVAVALLANPGGATLGGTTSVTAALGEVVFNDLVLDRSGSGYTMTATAASVAPDTTEPFNVQHAAPARLLITVEPSDVVAGAPITPAVTVAIADASGNIVTTAADSVAVEVLSGPSGASLRGPTRVAAVSGVAAFGGLSLDSAGTGYRLRFTATGLAPDTSAPFAVLAGGPARLTFLTGPPASVEAGAPFGVVVAVRDSVGNVSTAYTGPVTLGLGSGSPAGNLGGSLTVNAVAGVATFAALTLDRAGSGYTLVASAGALSSAPSAAFEVTPATAARIVITTEPPASVVAGAPMTIGVTARDTLGNTVTAFTGTVTLSLLGNPTGDTLQGTVTLAASGGVATFTTPFVRRAGVGYTILAESGALRDTSAAFSVVASGTTHLAFATQPPAAHTAGSAFSLVVAARDSFGNLATSFGDSVILALSSNPAGDVLQGTTRAAAAGGQAVYDSVLLRRAASGITLTATSGALPVATSSPFDIVPAAPAVLEFTSQPPGTVIAGAQFSVAVTVKDAFGNTVVSYNGSVTLALAANPGGATLSGTTTVSVSAGVASFAGLSLDRAGTGYTLSASSGALPAAASSTFNVEPSLATQLVFTTQPPDTITAGEPISVVVTARDAQGNTATSFADSVRLALAVNPGNDTIQGLTAAAPVNGVAAFTGPFLRRAQSGYALSATAGALSAASEPFTVRAAAATRLVIATEPPLSVTAGAPFAVEVAARDSFGNVVSTFADTVTLALLANQTGDTLQGVIRLAAVNGVASFTTPFLRRAGTGYTIEVSGGGLAPDTSISFEVIPAVIARLAITTEPPDSQVAGTAFGLTVTLLDAFGNTATGFSDSVTVELLANPAGDSLRGPSRVGATAGVATFSGLVLRKATTGVTLLVSADGATSDTSRAITIVPAPPQALAFTTQPPVSQLRASPFTVVVAALDSLGNVAPAFADSIGVAIGANPAAGTLSGTLALAAGAGAATFTDLQIDNIGAGYTLIARAAGLDSAVSIPFAINAPAGAVFWTNVSGGSWSTASNWSTGAVPTAADTVYIVQNGTYTVTLTTAAAPARLVAGGTSGSQTLEIGVGGTLRIDSAGSVFGPNARLRLSGGVRRGVALLSIGGVLEWESGSLLDSGTTRLEPGASLAVLSGSTRGITNHRLLIAGSATWSGSGNIAMGGTAGSPGRVTVLPGGSLTHDAGAGTFTDAGGGAYVTNQGTFTKPGGALTTFVAFINEGLLDVQSGSVALGGSPDSLGGTVQVGAGAELVLGAASVVLRPGVAVTGPGMIRMSSGTLAVDGAVTIPRLSFSGGAITGAGTLVIGDSLDWSGGTMTGGGLTHIAAGAVLRHSGTASRSLGNRTLRNEGTIRHEGAAPLVFAGSTMALLENLAGGLIEHAVGSGGYSYSSGTATIVNSGTLRSLGGTTSSVALRNAGTLEVLDGNLGLSGTPNVISGAIALAAPARLVLAGTTDSLQTGLVTTGAGSIQLTAGTLVTGAAGTDTVQVSRFVQTGGNANGPGVLLIADSLDWSAGNAVGGGALLLGDTALGVLSGGVTKTLNSRDLEVRGTLLFTGAGDLSLNNGATLRNAGGLIEHRSASGGGVSFGTGAALFTDDGSGAGVVRQVSNSLWDIRVRTVLTDTFRVDSGTVQVRGDTTRLTGMVVIDSGATLSLATVAPFSGVRDLGPGRLDVQDAGRLIVGATAADTVRAGALRMVGSGLATLSGPGVMRISRQLEWSGARMIDTGVTVLDSGAAATLPGGLDKVLTQRRFVNMGLVEISGSGGLVLGGTPAARFENQGTVLLSSTGGFSGVSGDVVNSGAGLIRRSGSGRAVIGRTLTNDGELRVESDTLALTAGYSGAPTGRITGTAVLDVSSISPVAVASRIEPGLSTGTLTLHGSINRSGTNSVTRIELGGADTTQYDRLRVTGSAGLAGTLQVSLAGGFTPVVGDSFVVMTYAARSGAFDSIVGLDFGSGTLDVSVEPTRVVLRLTSLPGAQLALATSPASLTAGTVIAPLQVEVRDSSGNVVTTDDSTQVTIQILPGTGDSTAGLSGTVTRTVSNGVALFDDLVIQRAAAGYRLRVFNGGMRPDTSSPFDVRPAPAARVRFGVQPPASAAAGAPFTVTVRALDQFGNLDTAYADSVGLVLHANPTSDTLQGQTRVEAVAGVAVLDSVFLRLAGTGYSLLAQSGGLQADTSTPLQITPAPATHLAKLGDPVSPILAGTGLAVAFAARDAFGNTDTSFSGTVRLRLDANPTGDTLQGDTLLAASAGTVTFSNASLRFAGSGYRLRAVSPPLADAVTDTFTVAAAPAVALAFVTQPPTLATAGSPFSVTVEARDAFGNIVSTFSDSVFLRRAGSGDTLQGTTAAAAINGSASFGAVYLRIATSATALIASGGGLAEDTSSAIQVRPAPATHLVFAAQPPDTVLAGAAFAVQAEGRDQFSNLDTAFTLNVAFRLAANPTGDTLQGDTLVPAIAGVADGLVSLRLASSQPYTIRAVAAGRDSAVSAPVIVIADTALVITLVSGAGQTDTVGDALAAPIRVRLTDSFGNPVAGNTIRFSTPDGGSFSDTAVVTDSLGEAQSFWTLGTVAGTQVARVARGADSLFVSAVAVPDSAVVLAFVSQPGGATAGQTIPQFEVEARDQFGNRATGFTAAVDVIAVIPSSLFPADVSVGGTRPAAAAGGIASFSDLSITTAAWYRFQAFAVSLPGGSAYSDSFSIAPATPSAIALYAGNSQTDTVAAVLQSPIQVRVTDSFNNAVPGAAVVFHALQGSTANDTVMTGPGGVAGTTWTLGTVAGIQEARAFAPGLADTVEFNATAEPGAATRLEFTNQPGSTVAGAALDSVVVRVTDQFGNTQGGYENDVTLALDSGSLGGTSQVGVTGGTAAFTDLTVTLAGTRLLIATAPSLQPDTSAPFTVSPAAATHLAFLVQPSAAVAGDTISPAVVVAARDSFENIATQFTDSVFIDLPSLECQGPCPVLFGTKRVAAAGGVATFSDLYMTTAGTGWTLRASGLGPQISSDTFTVSPAAFAQFIVRRTQCLASCGPPPSDTVIAGAADSVVAFATDQFGNLVRTFTGTVQFRASDTLALLPDDTTLAASDSGMVADTVILRTAGLQTVTIRSAADTTRFGSINFVVNAAAPVRLAFTSVPTSGTVGVALDPVHARVEDEFGNHVAGFSGSAALLADTSAVLTGTQAPVSNGLVSFDSVIAQTAGTYRLIVHDTRPLCLEVPINCLASDTSQAIAFAPGPAVALAVSADTLDAGLYGAVVVEARDAFGNRVRAGYTGTVAVAVDDSTAIVPPPYTFSASDSGRATLDSIRIRRAGIRLISASDSANGLSGIGGVFVRAGSAARLIVAPTLEEPFVAGNTDTVMVYAVDSLLNLARGYAGTVRILYTASDTLAGMTGFPPPHTFTAADSSGHAFEVRFFAAQSQRIFAHDSSNGLFDTSAIFLVEPGAAASVVVFGSPPTSGFVGQLLSDSLRVRVTDNWGNPVIGQQVEWTVIAGSGTINGSPTHTTLTYADGIASAAWLLGPELDTQRVRAVALGATGDSEEVFSVLALPPSVTTQWTGGSDGNWFNPLNWSAGVPDESDTVSVPAGTPYSPLISSSDSIGGLIVQNGASLTIGPGAVLTVLGSADASYSTVAGAGQVVLGGTGVVRGTFQTLTIQGDYRVVDSLLVVDSLIVEGIGARLTLSDTLAQDSQYVRVDSSLVVRNDATLRMDAGDSLDVGDVLFDGGSTDGLLTGGIIVVRGDFTQASRSSAQSFAAGDFHVVRFVGPGGHFVSFASGDSAGSRFGRLFIDVPDSVVVSGTVRVSDSLHLAGGTLVIAESLLVSQGRGARTEPGTYVRGDGTLKVTGEFTPLGSLQITSVWLHGVSTTVPSVTFNNLYLSGAHSIADSLVVNGNLHVFGAGTNVYLGFGGPWPYRLYVGGDLVVGDMNDEEGSRTGGRISMLYPGDTIYVAGNAFFGGDSIGFAMSRGALVMRGDLYQINRAGFTHTFNPRGSGDSATFTVIFPDSSGTSRVTFENASDSWLPRVLVTSAYGDSAVVFDSQTTIRDRLDATNPYAGIVATILTVTGSFNTQGPVFALNLTVGDELTADGETYVVLTTGFTGGGTIPTNLQYHNLDVLGPRLISNDLIVNGALTVNGPGAELANSGYSVYVNSSLNALGNGVTGTGEVVLTAFRPMAGGTVSNLHVTDGVFVGNNDTSLLHVTGTMRITAGVLNVGAFGSRLQVDNEFVVEDGSVEPVLLAMSGADDSLVAGNVIIRKPLSFDSLVGGRMIVTGSFTACDPFNGGTYAPPTSGSHMLVFDGDVTHYTRLCAPGENYFGRVIVTAGDTVVDSSATVYVMRELVVEDGGRWAPSGVTHIGGPVFRLSGTVTGSAMFDFEGQTILEPGRATVSGSAVISTNLAFGSDAGSTVLTIMSDADISGLSMHEAADSLIVNGFLSLYGVIRDTSLTAGTLVVRGEVDEDGSPGLSADSTGSFTMVFAGQGSNSFNFASRATASLRNVVVAEGRVLTLDYVGTHLFTGNVLVRDSARLDLTGRQLQVNGSFTVQDSGRLQMSQPGSLLDVFGDATFAGGSADSLLTEGTLTIRGNFTQSGAPTSFVGSAGHTTRFAGGAAQTVTFASPGTAASRFGRLTVLTAGDSLRLATDVVATGRVVVSDSLGQSSFATVVGGGGTLVITDTLILSSLGIGRAHVRPAAVRLVGGSIATQDGAYISQFSPDFTHFQGDGLRMPSGTAFQYRDVLIEGTTTPDSAEAVAVDGNLIVIAGSLRFNGADMFVTGDFATSGTGTLVMLSDTDTLHVGGNARFAGGSTRDSLTGGTLTIQGSFAQYDSISAESFAASGTHLTRLTGAYLPGPLGVVTVRFATPDTLFTGSASHFRHLDLASPETTAVHLLSDLPVRGRLQKIGTAVSRSLTGPWTVHARGLDVSYLVFDTTRLRVTVSESLQVQNVDHLTFRNQSPALTQFRFTSGESFALYYFTNIVFETQPDLGVGYYLWAENTGDGWDLYVNPVVPDPLPNPGLVKVTGSPSVWWGQIF